MRAKPVTAFATAIMAVALSGCATTVPGSPTASPSEVVASRTSTSTPAAGDDFLNYRWIDVSGQGNVTFSPTRHHQLGGVPLPGILLNFEGTDGTWDTCTVGPAVGNDAGNGFITAGHCYGLNGQQTLVSCESCAPQPLGALQHATSKVKDGPDEMIDGLVSDSGFIPADITGPATRIAGTWPVAGVLTVDGVRNLPENTVICIDGSHSGVQCAPKATADKAIIATSDVSQHGDSGAPVFVVEQGTNRAALAGIVRSGCDDHSCGSLFTFIDPALDRLGVKACLDPSVTAFSGQMFSTRVRSCR